MIGQHRLTHCMLGYDEPQRFTHPDEAYRLYLDALYAGDDLSFENSDGSVTVHATDI